MTEEIVKNEQHELTAGEMLRNARTTGRRKREIPTIAKQLCIREEFLQALEDGDYKVIPELVYILGFARNYAMDLGLDADEIVAKIKQELGVVSEAERVVNDVRECNSDKKFDFKKFVKFNWARDAYNWGRRNWILCTEILRVLIVAIVLLFVFSGDKSQDAQTPDAPVVASGGPVVIEPDFRKPVRERFETKNRSDANVIIQAVAESWVKIEDARGKTVFSRVLVAGDVLYLPKGDKYKGTFGNAGGIDIWVDGKLAPKVGADHVRKNSVSLAPNDLIKATTDKASDSGKAEDKSEKKPEKDKAKESDKKAE